MVLNLIIDMRVHTPCTYIAAFKVTDTGKSIKILCMELRPLFTVVRRLAEKLAELGPKALAIYSGSVRAKYRLTYLHHVLGGVACEKLLQVAQGCFLSDFQAHKLTTS